MSGTGISVKKKKKNRHVSILYFTYAYALIKFYILVYFKMYSYDAMLNFQSHEPLEIIWIYWSAAQETFLVIINVKNNYFG